MHAPLRLCTVLLSLVGIADALTLSGKVVNPDSTGRGGVVVSLAGTSLSTVTANDGTWMLSGATGAGDRSIEIVPPTCRLRIQDGRIRMAFAGRGPTGRILSGGSERTEPAATSPARAMGNVPDTLAYSWGGRVFLRDTVSASLSGIVRKFDTTWNAGVLYGYLTDARDWQTYRTVRIGSQTWMAQNLNYAGAGVCPADSLHTLPENADSCSKYGRLYSWTVALGLDDSCADKACSLLVATSRRGICPVGWHVPSDSEWQSLEVAAGMTPDQAAAELWRGRTVGVALKASSGWLNPLVPGTDLYGFRVLPAGEYVPSTNVTAYVGRLAGMWTSTEYGTTYAWHRGFIDDDPKVYRHRINNKPTGLSLRCIQDD